MPHWFEKVTQPYRARAERALTRYRDELSGRSIFLFPDSQLEIPLARFLSRELSMRLVEGRQRPICTASISLKNSQVVAGRCGADRRAGCRSAA